MQSTSANSMNFLYRLIWQQSWLALKFKKTAYKKLSKAGEVHEAPFEKDFFGLKYQGNLSNNIEFNIYYYGAFEKPLLFFLRDIMENLRADNEPLAVFFDVGANIGQHSLFMSQFAYQVHSFEPYPVVSAKLKQHISLNQIKNIQLHEVGLSNEDGALEFFAPTGQNQGIGSFDASTVEKGNVVAGKLELVEGDRYINENQLPTISLLKMDVEGFEKNALTGLRKTLEKDRPIVVCEISYGKELSFASLDEFREVLPRDYELYCFDIRKADGSKARRREGKARYSGEYRIIAFDSWRNSGQDDLIACPKEKSKALVRTDRV